MKRVDVSDDVTAQCLTSIVLLENVGISAVLEEFLQARTVGCEYFKNLYCRILRLTRV